MNKYRSNLEFNVSELLVAKDGFTYEPCMYPYQIHKQYLPDFVHADEKILIECKGFFRSGDTQKYKAIRDCLPDWELIFILSSLKKKVRKNSNITMKEWCTKEGFMCYTISSVHKLKEYIKDKKKCRSRLKS